jgi:hypothetical protein
MFILFNLKESLLVRTYDFHVYGAKMELNKSRRKELAKLARLAAKLARLTKEESSRRKQK